ncbi:MAG: zinc-ribbon domain-containing protein [Treponemataceae bacterium]
MAKRKPPKFFCEHCGEQVLRNAKVCPHCGSFFVNVRCPSCKFVGVERDFVNGCPKCGYAIKSNSKTKKTSELSSFDPAKTKSYDDEKLPTWIYVLVVFLFLFFLALVIL